ncbi:MAG: hypothetical protein ACYDBJ_17990 [Aggregatilineales bacterium]
MNTDKHIQRLEELRSTIDTLNVQIAARDRQSPPASGKTGGTVSAYPSPKKARNGHYVCPCCAANPKHDYVYLRKLDGGLDCKRCGALWDSGGQLIALPYGEAMPAPVFDEPLFAEYGVAAR